MKIYHMHELPDVVSDWLASYIVNLMENYTWGNNLGPTGGLEDFI